MKRISVSLVLLLAAFGASAAGALDSAANLIEIGDCAGAVARLEAWIKDKPADPAARLLMARAFAACPYDLRMPGAVDVGRNNRERALYQLEILPRLGKAGRATLLKAIADGDQTLTPLAVAAAGNRKVTAAVKPIAKWIDAHASDWGVKQAGVVALSKIGGAEAAAAVKRLFDAAPAPKRSWLAGQYLACLDESALLAVAKTAKEPEILTRLTSRRLGGAAALKAVAKRTDVAERIRTSALRGVVAGADASDTRATTTFLLPFLGDASASVRWAALDHLAGLDPDQAVPHLVAALDDEALRNDAISRLRRLKRPAAVKPLLAVLGEACKKKQLRWRDLVFRTMVESGASGDDLVKGIRLVLQSEPTSTAYGQPLALPRAVPGDQMPMVVDRLLADKDLRIRLAGIRSLDRLEPAVAVKRAAALLDDKSAWVRKYAANVLLRHAGTGLVPAGDLARLLASPEEREWRSAAATLARRPAPEAADAFVSLLKNETRARSVAHDVVRFFAAAPDKRAVPGLVRLAGDPKASASMADLAKALKACAADPSAAAADLAKGLKNKSSYVRMRAAEVLGALGDRSVLADLVAAGRAAQSSQERRVIDAAIRALTAKE